MNEKDILTQIRDECRSFSPDNFERIKESISDNYENAEVISAPEGVRFNRNIIIRFAATAAVLFFPVAFTVRYFADHSADNGGNDSEISVPAVSVSETFAVSEVTKETLTPLETTVYQTVYETVLSKTPISESEAIGETYQSESVLQQAETENVTEKPAETEAPVPETTLRLQETEAEKVTETEVTTVTEEPVPSAEQGDGSAAPSGTAVRESFISELMLVPGFTDRIYRIKYDASKADGSTAVYSVSGRNYRVESPAAYTICIYDVIIYGYDYFDFLNKGDYFLKKEYEYTTDEYFALDEQVLTMEELISSGFEATEE
ncbi:MAG: hypothetical protein ILP22_10535 [Oscillospiraceae bacterium]|nr:hypothetical protein [Oscillospiraceae bacterium]